MKMLLCRAEKWGRNYGARQNLSGNVAKTTCMRGYEMKDGMEKNRWRQEQQP